MTHREKTSAARGPGAALDTSALRESARVMVEGILSRRTTNGPFKPDPVSREHQHLLMRVAAAAPSHFNSQPWRFVLIEQRSTIEEVARISGFSMKTLIDRDYSAGVVVGGEKVE